MIKKRKLIQDKNGNIKGINTNIDVETVKPIPTKNEIVTDGVDILSLLNSLSPDKLEELSQKSNTVKKLIEKKALQAANEAKQNQIRIFPTVEENIHRIDDRDRTGIEVWVPGTGTGGKIKNPVFKMVSKHDYESRLKKMGFMLKEDFEKHRDINDMVDMWTKDGAKISAFRDQVPILLGQGLSVEPPLSQKIKK